MTDIKELTDAELHLELTAWGVSISQDVFNFKCEGTVYPKYSESNLKSFERKLKLFSELQKESTRRWQATNKINPTPSGSGEKEKE